MGAMVARIGPKTPKIHRHFFKEWRKKRGLSQDQLAERLETSKATVSRMENHKSQYNEGYVLALADALGVDANDLFRDPKAPTVDELLRALPSEKRDEIIRVLKAWIAA